MRIVINAAFLPEMYSEEYINYLSEIFKRITRDYLQHHFVFICEKPDAGVFLFGNNVEVYSIKTGQRNALSWKYWYDVRIPSLLRRYKADLFLSPGGFCSLRTNVPQCLIINDLFFILFPSFFTRTQGVFYKNHTRKSIQKAKNIITLSRFTKEKVMDQYGVATGKMDTIYAGIPDEYGPQPDSIKEKAKAIYAGGKEYFLYAGIIHHSRNLLNLLKAFSVFKKRQQSGLKLVICGKNTGSDTSFSTDLKTYKYRDDVCVIDPLPLAERVQLMAAAYAFVYPVLADDFSISMIEAMKSNVPVITSEHSAMQEITAGAALYVDPGNPQHIAEAMMRLYKDEKGRNELIVKGSAAAQLYNSEKSAGQLWQMMQTALL
jgi:glycosyltransferase involved in cell wall biosynthesis